MKLMNIFFTLLAAMAVAAAANIDTDYIEDVEMQRSTTTEAALPEIPDEAKATTSLRGVSRFLAQKNLLTNASCDKFPLVCHLRNSLGHDCCNDKCVEVKTDRFNCGACSHKCKYTEICCKGKCINSSVDKMNWGGCNKRCNKGKCVYGMCNYA